LQEEIVDIGFVGKAAGVPPARLTSSFAVQPRRQCCLEIRTEASFL